MKLKLSLLAVAVLISASSFAAPKPKAEGIYAADSTISHAPPRTTFALVEPNGEVWSVVDWYTSTSSTIYGDINRANGNGYGTDFTPRYSPITGAAPQKLRIETAVTEWTVRFTFYPDTNPITTVPSSSHHMVWNGPGPGGKREAYDVVLSKQPPESAEIPNTVLTSGDFTMSNAGGKLSGSFGNCNFNGNLKDGPGFKRLNLTLKNACYLNTTALAKGTKFEGAIFPSARASGVIPTVTAETAERVLDFAEASFPHYFPLHAQTLSSPPFLYRFYPPTGTYLFVPITASSGFQLGKVYVLGGGFGNMHVEFPLNFPEQIITTVPQKMHVLMIKAKTGSEYVGLSRTFPRDSQAPE